MISRENRKEEKSYDEIGDIGGGAYNLFILDASDEWMRVLGERSFVS